MSGRARGGDMLRTFARATVLGGATLVAAVAGAQTRVQCESRDYRYQFCPANGPVDNVFLIEQLSRSACIHGQTWGWDRRGIWVDRGCEAVFDVRMFRPAPVPMPDAGARMVSCESHNYQYEFCGVPEEIAFAQLANQRSRSACVEGRTWGWRPNGIWVSGGCEGDFQYRTSYAAAPAPPAHTPGLLYCESRDYQYTFCPTGRMRVVELVNQRSEAQCAYGRTWGYQSDGIWVDRGCAGEFSVRR